MTFDRNAAFFVLSFATGNITFHVLFFHVLSVKEYESAFGSRPRIPRTPDIGGKRPSSRETPQPKYSESGPRPSSAGRTSSKIIATEICPQTLI